MALTDWRLDHVWLLFRQHRAMSRARAQLASEIATAIRDLCPGEVFDRRCHFLVDHRIRSEIWPRYYGRFNGDMDAIFPRVILANTTLAWELAFKRARQTIVRHLTRFDPELLRALQDKAKEGTDENTG
jgi:hypothetical protein